MRRMHPPPHGRTAMTKTKPLPAGVEIRGRGYYAVRDVPRPLQAELGKRRLVVSLKTRNLHVALARRHAAQAMFQRMIEQAEGASQAAPEVEAGLAWREQYQALERGDPALIDRWGGAGDYINTDRGAVWFSPDELAGVRLDEQFGLEADLLAEARGPEAASVMRGLASGKMTPLLLYIDAWLAEGGTKGQATQRTQRQYRSDLDALAAWMMTIGVVTIEGVTKKTAGRYVTEALLGTGMNRVTANRKISAPSAYWRWLIRRGHATDLNPWAGQSLAKGAERGTVARTKRPFTASEVTLLFAGGRLKDDVELADTMHVAALSGLRLDEIYRLTVADCAGGWFNVRVSKSRAGVRRVPIHPALAELVARRSLSKPGTAFLLHEAKAVKGRERSAAISKRFGRYRQTVGVHEREEGQRHSSVDFHSFRRWFITSARNAGIDRAVVAAVVGHEAHGMTDGVYHGGPTEALKVACVTAVKLPL